MYHCSSGCWSMRSTDAVVLVCPDRMRRSKNQHLAYLPPHLDPAARVAAARDQDRSSKRGHATHLHVKHVRLDILLVLELEERLEVRHLRRRLSEHLGRD